MHGILGTFGGFLDEARDALSLPQLGRATLALASSLGYERCAIVDATDLSAEGRRAVLFASDGSPRKLHAQIYPEHPVSRFAEQNEGPFTLDELRDRLGIDPSEWTKSLPPEAQSGTSLLLPVHRRGRLVLKVAVNGPNADASPLARSMLHAAAHVVYDSIVALNERMPVALTNREAECLRWTSLGKNVAEIGKIVGISTRAVRSNLKNANKKLRVNTPLEALVKLAAHNRPPS